MGKRKPGKSIVSFKARFEDFVRLYNVVHYRSSFDPAMPEFGIRKIAQEKRDGVFLATVCVELEMVRGTFDDIEQLIQCEINDGGLMAGTLRSEALE